MAPPEAKALSLAATPMGPSARVPGGRVSSQSLDSTIKQKWYPRPAKARKSEGESAPPREATVSKQGGSEAETAPQSSAMLESRTDVRDEITDVLPEPNGDTANEPHMHATSTPVDSRLGYGCHVPPLPKVSTMSKAVPDPDGQTASSSGVPRAALVSANIPLITPGLTNPIHPLLHESRIYHTGTAWYTTLEPTLRLASRFLTLDAITKHLVVMVDGDLRRDTKPWGAGVETTFAELASLKDADGQPVKPNVSRNPKASQETVDHGMRERAAQILTEASDLMRFAFHDLQPSCDACTMAPNGAWERLFKSADLPRSSIILIQTSAFAKVEALYEALYLDCKQGRHATEMMRDLQIAEIVLASSFLHEIFHGLENAHNRRRADRAAETFYGDSPLAECGFAAEAVVFGGIPVEGLPSVSNTSMGYNGCSLLLMNWPSKCIQELYEGKPQFGIRQPSTPLGSELCFVQMSFVEEVFTDRYWEVEVPKLGQSSLHVPRRVLRSSPVQHSTKAASTHESLPNIPVESPSPGGLQND